MSDEDETEDKPSPDTEFEAAEEGVGSAQTTFFKILEEADPESAEEECE